MQLRIFPRVGNFAGEAGIRGQTQELIGGLTTRAINEEQMHEGLLRPDVAQGEARVGFERGFGRVVGEDEQRARLLRADRRIDAAGRTGEDRTRLQHDRHAIVDGGSGGDAKLRTLWDAWGDLRFEGEGHGFARLQGAIPRSGGRRDDEVGRSDGRDAAAGNADQIGCQVGDVVSGVDGSRAIIGDGGRNGDQIARRETHERVLKCGPVAADIERGGARGGRAASIGSDGAIARAIHRRGDVGKGERRIGRARNVRKVHSTIGRDLPLHGGRGRARSGDGEGRRAALQQIDVGRIGDGRQGVDGLHQVDGRAGTTIERGRDDVGHRAAAGQGLCDGCALANRLPGDSTRDRANRPTEGRARRRASEGNVGRATAANRCRGDGVDDRDGFDGHLFGGGSGAAEAIRERQFKQITITF